MIRYTCQFGRVNFYADVLPGCCGVAVIHDVAFYKDEGATWKQLYDAFDDYLHFEDEDSYDLARCKLLMSDGVDPLDLEDREFCPGSVAHFCTSTGWAAGDWTYNRKSGNMVCLFEKDKDEDSVRM